MYWASTDRCGVTWKLGNVSADHTDKQHNLFSLF